MEEIPKQSTADSLRIVIFGPESCGKSTLAQQLAAHFDTVWVPEYMRPYLQEKLDTTGLKISKDDLIPIARGQMMAENAAAESANKLLFCDTDLLQLEVYSKYYYEGFVPKALTAAVDQNIYYHYLLVNIDIPWVKDDLRDRPEERLTLFRIFEDTLKSRDIPYHLISGQGDERLQNAIDLINKLLSGGC